MMIWPIPVEADEHELIVLFNRGGRDAFRIERIDSEVFEITIVDAPKLKDKSVT